MEALPHQTMAALSKAVASLAPMCISNDAVEAQVTYASEREGEFAEYLAQVHMGRIGKLDLEIASAQKLLNEADCAAEALRMNHGRYPPVVLAKKQGELRTNILQLRGRLNLVIRERSLLNPFRESFRAQYRVICSIPRVVEVYVKPPRLVIRTDELYGKDAISKWHRIGRFEISFDVVNLSQSTFAWKNLDGVRENAHGPPNIYALQGEDFGRALCMGAEANAVITETRGSPDYGKLAALVVRYPECCGNQTTISLWPKVSTAQVPRWYIDAFGA